MSSLRHGWKKMVLYHRSQATSRDRSVLACAHQQEIGHSSGGITVYCANKFSGSTIVWKQDLRHRTHIWLKYDGSMFPCNDSLLVDCSLYKKVQATDLFQDILAEIAEARVHDQVLLTSNFRRTNCSVVWQSDGSLAEFVPLPSDNEFDTLHYTAPLRQSHDTCINMFDHMLLQICQSLRGWAVNSEWAGEWWCTCTFHQSC